MKPYPPEVGVTSLYGWDCPDYGAPPQASPDEGRAPQETDMAVKTEDVEKLIQWAETQSAWWTTKDAAEALVCCTATARKVIAEALSAQLLEQRGAGRTTCFALPGAKDTRIEPPPTPDEEPAPRAARKPRASPAAPTVPDMATLSTDALLQFYAAVRAELRTRADRLRSDLQRLDAIAPPNAPEVWTQAAPPTQSQGG